MRVPPDTFTKVVGGGYRDVYEYLPGWRTTPHAARRSVLLGRVQVVGQFYRRFFPANGDWPQDFRYAEGVQWLHDLFAAEHGADWAELSVPVRAGDASGRRRGPAQVLQAAGAADPVALGNREFLAKRAAEEKEREAARAAARRHEERMRDDPEYRANVLYREFQKRVGSGHALYYRSLFLYTRQLDTGQGQV